MTVIDFLERSAAQSPDKVAYADENGSVTYAELLDKTRRIGTAVAAALKAYNQPVVVMIDRNVESVCAFLGISTSRNFYVPVDVGQPVKRLGVILEQVRPAAIVTIDGNLPQGIPEAEDIPVLEYRDLVQQQADPALLSSVRAGCKDTDPLYAIYTSGSTGVPKGVLIAHRGVLDFIPVFAATFGFTAEDVFGNQAPFDFDVSVKDIYSTLFCGATMFIIPRRCFSMPKLLLEALDERKITVVVWAVSALCIVTQLNALSHRVPHSLKKILFSGEAMPIRTLNDWRAALPGATFVNLYGPTEVTCNCMYYVVDREFSGAEALPLGGAFANKNVFVLNGEDRPVAPGEIGEICVVGSSLALGYYRNPERTAAAFVQNPLNDRWPERMYRTGDMARLNENGEYVFVGRKDFQIKHMGHRIELGEIESAMNAAAGVERSCCLFDAEKGKIVGFYVGDADKAALFGELRKSLPKYMIPQAFLRVESFPFNHNGKIDRKKLEELYHA